MSDAVFDTPLQGCSLVEASAGTGKTYALAGLFVRAVIEGGLEPRHVLAVTYTVAATQELHARIRLRLEQATRLAAGWQAGDAATQEGDDAATAMLRRMLHAAVAAGESPEALRLRLARAARDLDLAQVTTIHGFCQRVLAEHALDAGQVLGEAAIETALAQARFRLAQRLWRERSVDAEGAAFLRRRFGDVAGLHKALPGLLAHEPILPEVAGDETGPRLRAAWHAVRQAFSVEGGAARSAIEQAIADRILSRAADKAPDVARLWAWLEAQGDAVPATLPAGLQRIGARWLAAHCLKGKAGGCPCSPLFEAIDALLPTFEARDIQWLQALRSDAQARDAERKAALQLRDYDDLIGALHAAVSDDATRDRLRTALRAQVRLALVDEFQDTDARQWRIFRALFADAAGAGLVLVGDPKQAIYGFRGGDVRTYVQAREHVQRDDIRLQRNFRSRPALLAASNALLQAMAPDALGAGIGFAPVQPGDLAADDDLQGDAAAAAPLSFHRVPPKKSGQPPADWNKDESIEHAAALCAEAIRDRLLLAREGRLSRREGGSLRPLEPRDCAVLVRTHDEAAAMRRALARRRVPAATVDRSSLYASDEARDLLLLLLALLHGGDDARLRAALATPLFGFDAEALVALAGDGAAWQQRQRGFEEWRVRWQRHGPQAMLAQVVAAESARMLGREGGERRIANLLQLGELLQEAAVRSMGLQGQVDWLQAAIANPDEEDEAQLPRLESDADRVQILTLHKSKGLEFPLVFLPFAGIGRDPARGRGPQVAVHHLGGERVRQWRSEFPHPPAPAWDEALRAHQAEVVAEDMRLVYVGITRARDALWLCGGVLYAHRHSALHALLGGDAPSPALRAVLGDALVLTEGLPPGQIARLPAQRAARTPPARVPTRGLRRDWWVHSFSQLHRQAPQGLHALVEEAPADDERGAPAAVVADRRFAGARFGNVLHHALEHADFAAWRDRDTPTGAEREVLLQAFAAFGYREDEALAGLPLLVPLVANTLHARIPGAVDGAGFRLCDLDRRDRIDEMEFHFALRGSDVDALVALLHAHGVLRGRRGFGGWRSLAGLMTGKIDLTCRVDGRCYVIDYKSNALPGFDADTVAQAVADSEYDWQALLYAVALQRWLRSRLGGEYDFERHVGGVRYLFCRGLDADTPGRGVHAMPFTRALIDTVDALLAAPWPGDAP